ncbi:MAG: O-antigen ligase family protein [Solirubrobacteraceae bacterium]|nr:O-antigen ligase family protein [Solirubrobacteraceae bacterium]
MSNARAWAAAVRARAGASPAVVILAALGAACGLSPFADGLYPSALWVPAGLGLLVVLTAAVIATPTPPPRAATTAVLLVAALGLLSIVSASWTDSIQRAVLEGNRLLIYAACLALAVVLLRSDRAAGTAFAAFALAALAVAGWVLVGMLRGDAAMFLDGRLHEPLGYINGQASFFLLAVWPCLALAERRRAADEDGRPGAPAAVAGLGLAAATLFAGLAVLGQSRGVVIAAAAALLVVLALAPGRLRRIVALLVLALCLAPAMPALLAVYSDGASAPATRDGALALLGASVAAGVIWALLVALERRGRRAGLRPRRAVAIGVTVVGVLAAAAAVASADRIASFADRQYSAFVKLDTESGGAPASRLQSGAGNRYDYWRVAVEVWREHPAGGVGAGGYDKAYFARRATIEDIRQPHSLPLQVLAELGVAGGLPFAAAVLVIAGGAWRRLRDGGRDPLTVAALGLATAWFVHAGVDWIHLLPGLTGIALIAAALLLRPARADDAAQLDAQRAARAAGFGPTRSRAARAAPAVAIGLAIAFAALSLGRQGLSERYVQRAQAALAREPDRALVEANRALRLDREAVAAYYAKAAALARFNQAAAARSVLLDAARREPRNFVTWVLLGDLSVRRGDLRAARSAYGRALQLNPRGPGLARLAADPGTTSRGSGGGG